MAAAQAGYDQAVQLAETRIMSQVAQARAGVEAADAALEQVRDLAETRIETQIQQAQAALDALKANLEREGILIRYYKTHRLRDHIRISVGRPEQTDVLIEALKNL